MTPRPNPGPFLKRFFLSDIQIEALAKHQLEALKLMPGSPGPVAVEKYCERRWGFSEDYLDLDPGVLGCAVFSENGVEAVAVSRELGEDTGRIGIVRTRSTLAHEIGHGELHSDAFSAKIRHDRLQGDLFSCSLQPETAKILCRDEQIRRPRSEEWWEIQANRFMVALLLPNHLLREVVENGMPNKANGKFHPIIGSLDTEVASIFQISKEMARIAADAMHKTIMNERQEIVATWVTP